MLRREFLMALALIAAGVGLPLAVLAAWWGASIAETTAASGGAGRAYCAVPAAPGTRLKLEEIDLRRRIAALETDIAERASQCPICPPAPPTPAPPAPASPAAHGCISLPSHPP